MLTLGRWAATRRQVSHLQPTKIPEAINHMKTQAGTLSRTNKLIAGRSKSGSQSTELEMTRRKARASTLMSVISVCTELCVQIKKRLCSTYSQELSNLVCQF